MKKAIKIIIMSIVLTTMSFVNAEEIETRYKTVIATDTKTAVEIEANKANKAETEVNEAEAEIEADEIEDEIAAEAEIEAEIAEETGVETEIEARVKIDIKDPTETKTATETKIKIKTKTSTSKAYGIYMGLGISQSKWEADNTAEEYQDNNYKLLMGKKLNDKVALEWQYVKARNSQVLGADAADDATMGGLSKGVSVLYYFMPDLIESFKMEPDPSDPDPYVKFGFHAWELEDNVGGKTEGEDMLYAAGVDARISDSMKFRFELEQMILDTSDSGEDSAMNNIGGALLFGF